MKSPDITVGKVYKHRNNFPLLVLSKGRYRVGPSDPHDVTVFGVTFRVNDWFCTDDTAERSRIVGLRLDTSMLAPVAVTPNSVVGLYDDSDYIQHCVVSAAVSHYASREKANRSKRTSQVTLAMENVLRSIAGDAAMDRHRRSYYNNLSVWAPLALNEELIVEMLMLWLRYKEQKDEPIGADGWAAVDVIEELRSCTRQLRSQTLLNDTPIEVDTYRASVTQTIRENLESEVLVTQVSS